MPVREFVDSYGTEWRAWDITPESIYPQTKVEDYLADCYLGGWVVFETLDGGQKRRLCPIPYAWDQRPEPDLERLLDSAEIIRPRPSASAPDGVVTVDLPPNVPPRAAALIPRTSAGDIDLDYLGVVRSFVYPGGRVWAACVVLDAESPSDRVLRFVSGARMIELREWPADWIDYSDRALAELLHAATPRGDAPSDVSARRRADDAGRDDRLEAR